MAALFLPLDVTQKSSGAPGAPSIASSPSWTAPSFDRSRKLMALLQRITTPFVALLPDLDSVSQRRQAIGAIVASLVLHLLLLLFFASMAGLIPDLRVDFAKP